MPSDRTRTSNDLRQRYKAVVMQQGRVTLDRDFNALQEIVEGQIAADALDEIGPCGTPDDGFAISLPTAAQAAAFSADFSTPDFWDFLIGPGTMYVGGQRVELHAASSNQPAWSYFNQPDWLHPAPPVFTAGSQSTPPNEYVFLHVYEQEVSAVEDGDLLDVALGGPDTTQRVRLMWRAIRVPTDASDCATALADAAADWAAHGFKFDPTTMRRLPQVGLQVSFTATQATSTPCDPIEQGGYLGAENQLIRLQISESAGKPQLLWGYDDASFLYRFSQTSDNSTLLLNQVPVDAYHSPTPGQVVEVLRSSTILGTEPNSTGSTPIVRCVAEASGFVTTIKAYVNSSNTVTLSSPLPTSYLKDSNPQFLRIWQGQQPIVLSSQPITLLDPTTNTSPGIQVTLTVPSGGPSGASLPTGAYWMIAVRPSTPQLVYPERFLTSPQPPDGPREWICPLAVIEWARDDFVSSPSASFRALANIIDCRQTFCNLVKLSKRGQGGCCSVSVKPSDAPNLQTILDKAASAPLTVTVCFSSGTYSLSQPLRLSAQHSGLVLEACGDDVTIQASPDADMTGFLDGLIVLVLANDVTFKNLTILAPSVPFQNALQAQGLQKDYSNITSTPGLLESMVGIRVFQCLGVTIKGCSIQLSPVSGFLTIGYGVHLSGDCTGLAIEDCQIASSTVPIMTSTEPTNVQILAEEATASIPQPDIAAPTIQPLLTALPSSSQPVSSSIPITGSPAVVTSSDSTQGLVALFGIFADSISQTISVGGSREQVVRLIILTSVLDGGRLVANVFTNFATAVRCLSALGSCQIQGNHLTSCFSGFRLEASDYLDPSVPTPDQSNPPFNSAVTTVLNFTLGFKEITTGDTISGYLPLPVGMSLTQFQTLSSEQSAPPPIVLSLSNNQIDASIADAPASGGAAVMLRLNRSQVSGEDTSSSLIMASNQIRGNPFVPFYLPLVLLFPGGMSALTGNLIESIGRDALNLWIFPPTGWTSGSEVAVSGNVFIGTTNLSIITRPAFTAPLNTWLPFNANNP